MHMKQFLILLTILSFQAKALGPGDRSSSNQIQVDRLAAKDFGAAVKTFAVDAMTLPGTTEDNRRTLGDVLASTSCEEEICDVTVPEPREHLKFGVSFIRFGRSGAAGSPAAPSSCNCLVDKVKGNKSQADFDEERNRRRDEINQKILTSYGKKFVNSFANNMEDMTFFLNQSKYMFKSRESALALQCNDQAVYNNKINEVCGARRITDRAFIENRKNLFINAVSGGTSPFDQRLQVLGDEVISSIETPDFDVRDQLRQRAPVRFARVNYDQTRMHLATHDPEAEFVTSLMSRILQDNGLNTKMTEALGAGITPVEAFLKVIKENKASKNNFRDYGFGRGIADRYLKDDKSIEDAFKFIMQVHPGMNMALTDKASFDNVRTVVRPGTSIDIFSAVNGTQNVLEPILVDRCNKMVEEFASAVCTKDENLIATVDPVELSLLLNPTTTPPAAGTPKPEPGINELLICEARVRQAQILAMGATASGIGTFALDSGRSNQRRSDYMAGVSVGDVSASAGGTGAPAGSLISHLSLVISSNPDMRAQVATMIDENNKTRTGFSGPGIVGNRVLAQDIVSGRSMRLGNNSMSQEDARRYLAEDKKWVDQQLANSSKGGTTQTAVGSQIASGPTTTEEKSQSAQTVVQPQTLAGPQTTPGVTTPDYSLADKSAKTKQDAQAREQLRQYISDKNDPVEATRAVSALDDASVAELNRLRKEKEDLLKQQLKEGEQRLADMRAQLADASKVANVPVVERDPASVDEESDEVADESSSSSSSSGRGPRAADLRSALNGGAAGGGQATAAGGAATSGSQSGSQSSGSSDSGSKEISTSDKTVVTTSDRQVERTESGSIVITATDVKASANLPQQELNQEVQKFLSGADLSSTSIQDIKSKGIKIRFNVMENNKLVQKEVVVRYENLDRETRNQIDLKLARKNVQNQVSKLAVLRMLIKQNKSI